MVLSLSHTTGAAMTEYTTAKALAAPQSCVVDLDEDLSEAEAEILAEIARSVAHLNSRLQALESNAEKFVNKLEHINEALNEMLMTVTHCEQEPMMQTAIASIATTSMTPILPGDVLITASLSSVCVPPRNDVIDEPITDVLPSSYSYLVATPGSVNHFYDNYPMYRTQPCEDGGNYRCRVSSFALSPEQLRVVTESSLKSATATDSYAGLSLRQDWEAVINKPNIIMDSQVISTSFSSEDASCISFHALQGQPQPTTLWKAKPPPKPPDTSNCSANTAKNKISEVEENERKKLDILTALSLSQKLNIRDSAEDSRVPTGRLHQDKMTGRPDGYPHGIGTEKVIPFTTVPIENLSHCSCYNGLDVETMRISRGVELFEKLEQVGGGLYEQVFMAIEKTTREIVALQRIRMDNERAGLKILDRVNVIKLMDNERVGLIVIVMSTEGDGQVNTHGSNYKGSIHMGLEYMDHDLTGHSNRPGQRFTIPQIKGNMEQLLTGLPYYCHLHLVFYQDIIWISNAAFLRVWFSMPRPPELTLLSDTLRTRFFEGGRNDTDRGFKNIRAGNNMSMRGF